MPQNSGRYGYSSWLETSVMVVVPAVSFVLAFYIGEVVSMAIGIMTNLIVHYAIVAGNRA
jgi:hypothetical protein